MGHPQRKPIHSEELNERDLFKDDEEYPGLGVVVLAFGVFIAVVVALIWWIVS